MRNDHKITLNFNTRSLRASKSKGRSCLAQELWGKAISGPFPPFPALTGWGNTAQEGHAGCCGHPKGRGSGPQACRALTTMKSQQPVQSFVSLLLLKQVYLLWEQTTYIVKTGPAQWQANIYRLTLLLVHTVNQPLQKKKITKAK